MTTTADVQSAFLDAIQTGDYTNFFRAASSARAAAAIPPPSLPFTSRNQIKLPKLTPIKPPKIVPPLAQGVGKGQPAGLGLVNQTYGVKTPIGVILSNAQKMGLDPAAVIAYALEESNAKWGAVGDQGTSFGPFQAHIGGAAGNRSPQAAAAWANSPAGLIQMMGMMSRTPAKGLEGEAAVKAIYQYFGKGTPAAVPKGLARLPEAQKIVSSSQLRRQMRSNPRQLASQLASKATGRPTQGWRYPQMVTGQRSPYKHLAFQGHVDWGHVDTTLLAKLDALAKMLHVTISVNSGYRSPGYSTRVGGYANDPHARGVAIDAYINGVPIGNYKGAYATLKQLGLESGAQPNFYNGQPDPMHVQIPGSGINKALHASKTYL